MKATGIVRRIDDLGRVVIPKEIRRTLRIREGDPLEIFTDREGGVILKKYSVNPPNVYGFGQNTSSEAGVISIFMEKMFKGENPTIFGNGEHIRDYIYIDDVVRINCQCLRDEFTNIIMNVGTGIQTTTNDIFRQINPLFDNKFEEKHISAQDGEIKVNYLFIDPLLKKPELIPKTKLKEGIEQTFKKYKEINTNGG